MESINLNLIPTGANPVVHVSQYDTGRVIRFNIFEGSSVYFLDGTETISCNIKKPDNNIVTLSVTNTTDSYVEITTTEQTTACDGSNLCEISITKGDDVIGSLNFIMEVERSPIEGGIESESEINNLWTQVDGMVADALATQYDSANVVFDNEPTEGHGIPYTVTSEGIGNAIDNALDMTAEASGAIATFESEYALPLRDLEIKINAVQESGTPTPSSPKAISGFTGANITNHGKNYLDTSTNVNGKALSATGAETSISQACYTDLIKVVVGEKYTFGATSALVDAWNRRIHGYDESGNWVQEIMNSNAQSYAVGTPFTMTFTVPNGISYVRISYYKDTNAQLEKGEIASAYQAYNSTTTAITWQDEAGTVYGGSLDVTSGLLTITMIDHVFDGTENFISLEGGTVFAYNFGSKVRSSYQQTNSLNTHFTNNTAGNAWANVATDCYLIAGDYYVGVNPNMSLADYKTWLGTQNTNGTPVKAVATLQTPVTYQLTPTQISAIVGTNNVFTDTNGDTSLEYYTKRGEQTVRIAEGVAVDVINNKSIDTLATTDKTVKGAINELDGIIDGIKAIETLFVTATIATSTTEYTTYNSRKFSDYDFYLFKIGASALDVRRTVILSKADWKSGASINEVMLHGSTASTPSSYTASTFTAGYHSDTSFDANVSGSGSLNCLTIHGIRKN